MRIADVVIVAVVGVVRMDMVAVTMMIATVVEEEVSLHSTFTVLYQ